MTQNSKKNRIIFIDLMRAFAVLMMVQGHTVDVLLSNNYRNMDSPVFAFWLFMRGMTAPIFLFTAGTVFTYLYRLVNEPFKTNPRAKKGLKRFLLLLSIGYLLRYPTPKLIDFSNVTAEGWKIFYAVDVLQLIAFGLLFVLILIWAAEKFNINDYWVFSAGALFFFALYPITANIDWKSFLPVPLAGYFYRGTGSNFPLFPWAGYVIGGGVLGSYLANNPMVFKTYKFSGKLLIGGALFIAFALIGDMVEKAIYGQSYLWTSSPNLVFLRLGIVLLLNSAVSFISLRINNIPRFFILIGRNTLLIYVVHLMILYGSAWNPGLSFYFDKSFGVWRTVGSALSMLAAMTIMVYSINRFKMRNRQLAT